MKTALLIGASLSGVLLPGVAMAQEACGSSYMVLPDGSCTDMSYLTIMGSVQRQVAITQSEYNSLYQANLALEFDSFYRAGESDAERDERFNIVAGKSIELDDTRAAADSVRDRLYPFHMAAMNRVSQAYSPQFSRR